LITLDECKVKNKCKFSLPRFSSSQDWEKSTLTIRACGWSKLDIVGVGWHELGRCSEAAGAVGNFDIPS
jgi:hypothetical protein